MADPILQALVHVAIDDATTIGLILGGSRAAGTSDEDSDYDVIVVLTDSGYQERQARGQPLRLKTPGDGQSRFDLGYSCPRELSRIAATPGWWTPGYASSRVLLDKTGEVAHRLAAIARMPEGTAHEKTAASFDAYLNAFYRSMKAWRRRDDLGACLHAADSAMHLIRTLFCLEARWPPYWDRLGSQLEALNAQGWNPRGLRAAIFDLLDNGKPEPQVEIEARVESLMRSRGFGHVVDAWGEDLDYVKSVEFREAVRSAPEQEGAYAEPYADPRSDTEQADHADWRRIQDAAARRIFGRRE